METIVFLNEIRGLRPDGQRGNPRWTPQFTDLHFEQLADSPSRADERPLIRMGCKMATGSGKTVVTPYRDLLRAGQVLLTNWHWLAPESEHAKGGRSNTVVKKGEETDEACARNRLGELFRLGPIMVLNDEGHHAYRPAPVAGGPDPAGVHPIYSVSARPCRQPVR